MVGKKIPIRIQTILEGLKMPARPKTGKRAETGFKSTGKSRAKQSFRNETDINQILHRVTSGASLAHLKEHEGQYGDFSDFDEQTYEQMQNRIAGAKTIFFDLPAELRSEFDNNPGKFFGFVNDPANVDKLEEIFPALAAPGRDMPPVNTGVPTPPEPIEPVVPAPPAPIVPPAPPVP